MITADNVRELYVYDPETGIVSWKSPPSSVKIGARAGSVQSNGYRVLRHKNKPFQEHRVIWLYVHGVWPPQYIDHINGNKTDNRLSNLRLATPKQNCWNAKTRKRNGGLPGTSKQYNRWNAKISINGERRFLGCFDTEQEAHQAYVLALRELCGEYAPRF
jgi:hypothetical protein